MAVAALRSALAAIANAEAVTPPAEVAQPTSHPTVAGSFSGLGAAETERRMLSEAQVEGIVRTEVVERLSAAVSYERVGRGDRAERLRAESEVLSRYLDPC